MDFHTPFKAASAVEIHEPDYVVLLDNCNNVIAVFPRGKYPYPFWKDFLPHIVRDIDMSLEMHGCSKEFRKLYEKFFLGLRKNELKKAFKVTAELDWSRPNGGEPRRRKSSEAKRKDESAA